MTKRVDLYSTYSNFTERVLAAIREETFGVDIGQNSWLTADEYDRFIAWLDLEPEQHALEVASGSGGPARKKRTVVSQALTRTTVVSRPQR